MKNVESYDILIENIEKEWDDSMNENLVRKWEIPIYSKSQINKAVKTIMDYNTSKEDIDTAFDIINNWRSAHSYPLHVITSNLRNNNRNAIVVQRLKRLDSIIGKIKRFPEMSLYRMQDLGGCRVIVNSIDDVYKVVKKYNTSRIRHELKNSYDYIVNPKKSGYRSYHMVYKFHSDKKELYNKNMLIEIQVRTKLQHMWATAIEMMGIYTKSQLKAGIGDEHVLRFFSLVSSLFALEENMPIVPETSTNRSALITEIKTINSEHKIIPRLRALKVATNLTTTSGIKNGYYILTLDYKKSILKVKQYKMTELDKATYMYNKIENGRLEDIDCVLVSASSFDSMKAAYPNYFYDISEFAEKMKSILT